MIFLKNNLQVRDNPPETGVRQMRNNILHLPDPSLGGSISYQKFIFEEHHAQNQSYFGHDFLCTQKIHLLCTQIIYLLCTQKIHYLCDISSSTFIIPFRQSQGYMQRTAS